MHKPSRPLEGLEIRETLPSGPVPYPKPWPCNRQPWDTPQGLALLGPSQFAGQRKAVKMKGEATVGQLGKEIRIQSQIGIFLLS